MIGVTPNGNLYEKTNTATVTAATAGGIAGAAYGLKNVGKIITYCDDVLKESAKEKMKDAASQVKDTFASGQVDKVKVAAEKYGSKIFDKAITFIRNNPVKILAVVGALLTVSIGTAIDKTVNDSKAAKIDKAKQQ